MVYTKLVALVAEKTGYTYQAVREIIDVLRDTCLQHLSAPGDAVYFHRFGVFKVSQRAARKVKSPFLGRGKKGQLKTGLVAEHLVVKFRPSRRVRRMLNP